MIFSIRKLFRHNRSHQRLQRDRIGRLLFELRIFFKRLIARVFTVGDRMTARVRGFTLIELLVSMLIATVIISTLLAFTVNIMETDRREQAKVESQSDIQAALNYISDDLQEAVYIYNADSLNTVSAVGNTNTTSGIKDQLPQVTDNSIFANSTPVLVFWKRKYYNPTDTVNVGGGVTKQVGCLAYGTSTTSTGCYDANGNPIGSGQYAYSLVAYYLIYDNASGANPTWSNAARLGRWELNDGIRSTCQADYITTPTACSDPKPIARVDFTPPGAIAGSSMVNYWTAPDQGFTPFSSQGGTVDSLMNQWTKAPAGYLATNTPTVLMDFLDDSPYSTDQDDGIPSNAPVGNAPVDIPIRANVAGTPSTNPDCYIENVGTGGASSSASQRIPATFSTASSNPAQNISSFYVCVNSSQNVARIYLRGNALARLRLNQTVSQRLSSVSSSTLSSFFSTGNIRAYGNGRVYTQ